MAVPRFPPEVELEHLRAELARVQESTPVLQQQLRERRLACAKEELDVERTRGDGLAAFFERLFGERRRELAREKAEAASARLKRDTAAARYDQARAREIELAREIERIAGGIDRAGERVARVGHARAVHELQLHAREIEEALEACSGALRRVEWVDGLLASARSWGTWDMLGGGAISTWIKHSKLDQAHEQAAALQSALQRLARELEDVDLDADLGSITIDGFSRFADWFFDGFFVDWMVQGRIVESIQNVARLRGKLQRVRGDLEARSTRVGEELVALGENSGNR